MELEIMKRKLNLIQHIKNLDDNCLAKEIYNEQIRNNWPGLTKECEELCVFLNIPNVITTEMTKGAWKNKVKQSIREKNSQNLKDKMEKYSKLEEMRQEEKCELKSYFSDMTMEEARTHFRIRSKMINCKFNHSSDPKYRAELWRCSACGNVDTQSHILWCSAYSKLREGKSLENDRDIAQYYHKVMCIREKLKLDIREKK